MNWGDPIQIPSTRERRCDGMYVVTPIDEELRSDRAEVMRKILDAPLTLGIEYIEIRDKPALRLPPTRCPFDRA